MTFYDRFARLCNEIGKTPSKVCEEIGFQNSAASIWKKRGNTPTRANLIKIAEYFNVSVMELLPPVEMSLDKLHLESPIDAYVYLKNIAEDKNENIDEIINQLDIDPMLFQMAMFKRSGYDKALEQVYNAIINDAPLPQKENQPTAVEDSKLTLREDIMKDINNLSDEEVIRLKAILHAVFPDKFSL